MSVLFPYLPNPIRNTIVMYPLSSFGFHFTYRFFSSYLAFLPYENSKEQKGSRGVSQQKGLERFGSPVGPSFQKNVLRVGAVSLRSHSLSLPSHLSTYLHLQSLFKVNKQSLVFVYSVLWHEFPAALASSGFINVKLSVA